MAETIPIRGMRDRASTRPATRAPLPKPPRHLSARARRIWTDIVSAWVVGPEAQPVLRAGLEQLDTYDRAQRILKREGLTFVHAETGMIRAHPANVIAKDALREFRQCFRQLGLQPPEV